MCIRDRFKPDVNFGQALIKNYETLKEMNVQLKKLDKNYDEKKAIYTLILTNQMNQFDIVAELSVCEYVAQVIV